MKRLIGRGRSVGVALAVVAAFLLAMPVAEAPAGIGDAARSEVGLRYWSACAPIVVEIVPSSANPLFEDEVKFAVRDISERMGLTVLFTRGRELPTPGWVGSAPVSGEGDRVLRVGVADHGDLLTRGFNGEVRSQVSSEGEIVRASVVLSQKALAWMVGGPAVPNPGSRLRLLVMHEVGHAFGLRHSDDYANVMSTPAISYVGPDDAWGPGDLDEIGKRRVAAACG